MPKRSRARHIAPDIDAVAERCEVPRDRAATFFSWFAEAERTVTLNSQGVNQSAQSTDKVNAIINCHLATGRIGRPGTGPFSLTGQPNAMGGREVGGLANQLAAHMDFDAESIARIRRFWSAPRVAERPSLKAVELFEAVGARTRPSDKMATPTGFEPVTPRLGIWCSIQLSYGAATRPLNSRLERGHQHDNGARFGLTAYEYGASSPSC